ncbi:FLYWCH zinc finger domain-containing protein [Phthorimaea operculella]|nr:FLYWCH zinc finger domain-containing protein [Phthorimaea operculella]
MLAVCDGYTFYHQQTSKTTMRWSCLRQPCKCSASLTTDKEGALIRVNVDHNHPPPKFTIHNVYFATSKRGNPSISVDGFTFRKHQSSGVKSRWLCSTHNNRGCKALLHTIDGIIVKIRNEHHHEPPASKLKKT